MTIAEYLRMPWTIVRSVHDDDGEYIALHVQELPGFVVAARTDDELERRFWDAFPEFLESYLVDGDEPPLPNALLAHPPQLDLGPAMDHRPRDLTTRYSEQTARSVGSGPTQRYPTTASA
jgi:hypothetical protein